MTLTTSKTLRTRTERNRRLAGPDLIIAWMVAGAVAIVGVNRPSVSGLPPSVFLIGGAFVVAMMLRPATVGYQRRLTPIDVLLGVWFTAKVIVEYSNSAEGLVPFSLGPVLDCALVAMVVVIVKRRIGDVDRAVAYARVFVGAAVVVSLIALLQVLDVGGVNQALASVMGGSALEARIENGWDIRATATIGHWTALGGYLCIAIAVCCALMIHAHHRGDSVRGTALALAVMVGGQVSTFTFATMSVAGAIIAVTIFIVRPRPAQVVGVAAVLGVLWWTFSDVIGSRITKQLSSDTIGTSVSTLLPESVGFRVNIWITETIPAVFEKPFTGYGLAVYNYVGTGRVPYLLKWQSPESEWMRTAVSSGLFVLCLEAVTLLAVLRLLWSVARRSPASPLLPIVVMAASMVVAMCIHSHLADRAFLLSFWMVATVISMLSPPTPTRRT